MISGFLGAIFGTPFDVAVVRKQASITTGKQPYRSTYATFKGVIKEDGVLGLWAGLNITILRVLLINFGQLAAHEKISDLIKPYFRDDSKMRDNTSAIMASVFTGCISLPADNIKVKLQKEGKKLI